MTANPVTQTAAGQLIGGGLRPLSSNIVFMCVFVYKNTGTKTIV